MPLARDAVTAARTSKDDRLIARALLVLGRASMSTDPDHAAAPLNEAMLTAIASGQDELATEAYARHGFVVGAFSGVELAEALGRRAGERGAFARALLANNRGALSMISGDARAARAQYRSALDLGRAVSGPDAFELLIATSNLAMLTPEADERRELYARALATTKDAVGADHPQTLVRELQLAADDTDPRAVVGKLRDLCDRMARLHSHLRVYVEYCAFELVWQATALGDTTSLRAALALAEPQTPATFVEHMLVYYRAISERSTTGALLDEAEQLARDERSHIGLERYGNAADAELAVVSLARIAGDTARMKRALEAANADLGQLVATMGAEGGYAQRRRSWARTLASD